ncbi:MAG TPA: RNA methyltransferase [Bacteroidia bacterium]
MLSKNQLKNITALHSKKHRQEEQIFIAEGEKMLQELLASDFEVEIVFATVEWLDIYAPVLSERKIQFQEIPESDLKKISLLSTPNKVLALVKQKHAEIDRVSFANSLHLYLDGIRDPGNLGTIIRLAHWFGVSQVICSPDTVEIYNPKTVQSTMGSIFRVNVLEAELSDILQDEGSFPVFGALLDGENIYQKQNFTSGILVIGNESNGISSKNLKFISDKVKIPPASESHAESLNAAMATSIFLSEYLRRKKYF